MKRILLQLDTDELPSVFDRVVAIDAGVDHVLSYGGITPENVVSLVHGAIFTRGPNDLVNTAIFIGGSEIQTAEKVLAAVKQSFVGPMKVSVMLDPNGSTTTAAATVRCASRHVSLKDNDALVLGGTGPVGLRTAQILASQGARVRIASRNVQRAEAAAALVRGRVEGASVVGCENTDDGIAAAVDSIEMLFAAGAPGVSFLSADEWQGIETLKVAIDLNAVPPVGLEGIGLSDQAQMHGDKACYGALGVGGLKMKIHLAAIQKLFTASNLLLDTDAIYALSNEV